MKKKTPKRYKLVKNYLHKICDGGHHTLYKIELMLSPEEYYYKRIPDDAIIHELNEWDMYFEGKGTANTANLIKRDINVFWAVEKVCSQQQVTIDTAIEIVIQNWTSKLGPYLGDSVIKEIYKNYAPLFRFLKNEDPTLNFPLRDAAAYTLREMKVLTGWYPNIPSGICENIHNILELPLEEDIEKELKIYQRIRHKAFGITYSHHLRLRHVSMGYFNNRFTNRNEKIVNAIKAVVTKYNIDFSKIVKFYSHYRLIEAEDNGQNLFRVYELLQSDLKNTESI